METERKQIKLTLTITRAEELGTFFASATIEEVGKETRREHVKLRAGSPVVAEAQAFNFGVRLLNPGCHVVMTPTSQHVQMWMEGDYRTNKSATREPIQSARTWLADNDISVTWPRKDPQDF